jgi:hypothetical protein
MPTPEDHWDPEADDVEAAEEFPEDGKPFEPAPPPTAPVADPIDHDIKLDDEDRIGEPTEPVEDPLDLDDGDD